MIWYDMIWYDIYSTHPSWRYQQVLPTSSRTPLKISEGQSASASSWTAVSAAKLSLKHRKANRNGLKISQTYNQMDGTTLKYPKRGQFCGCIGKPYIKATQKQNLSCNCGTLSPKRSSAVLVESFSLMMGTTPSERHSMMVTFLRWSQVLESSTIDRMLVTER